MLCGDVWQGVEWAQTVKCPLSVGDWGWREGHSRKRETSTHMCTEAIKNTGCSGWSKQFSPPGGYLCWDEDWRILGLGKNTCRRHGY